MKNRDRLSKLHGFVGLLGGLLLVVMGLTGSAIVFHRKPPRNPVRSRRGGIGAGTRSSVQSLTLLTE